MDGASYTDESGIIWAYARTL